MIGHGKGYGSRTTPGLRMLRMTEVFLSGSSKNTEFGVLFHLEPFHTRSSVSSKISII